MARFLRNRGIGPEVLTGICVERSVEMVVGILGILKAGGAYVPLDPKYPKQRLAFILEDTQAPVRLTQQRLVAGIRSSAALEWSSFSGYGLAGNSRGKRPESAQRFGFGKSRLCDVHLRFNGRAQGCEHRTPERRASGEEHQLCRVQRRRGASCDWRRFFRCGNL